MKTAGTSGILEAVGYVTSDLLMNLDILIFIKILFNQHFYDV